MKRSTVFATALIAFSIAATPLLAEDNCELPPDIDEDERYVMKFKNTKVSRYKILDVEGCWVQTMRTDGNHRWWPIENIEYIGSKPIKE